MLVLFIILLVLTFGAFPAWPHSGYYPSGGIGLILVMVLLFMLLNHGV